MINYQGYSFTVLWLFLMVSSCCSTATLTNPSVEQGIAGTVREIKGNRMPAPGARLPEPQPLRTTLYIFEETSLADVEREGTAPLYRRIHTRLVATVEPDEEGRFQLSLPPGRYSLFTRHQDLYFANLFDERNMIYPVVVEKARVTRVDFLVDIDAVY